MGKTDDDPEEDHEESEPLYCHACGREPRYMMLCRWCCDDVCDECAKYHGQFVCDVPCGDDACEEE